MITMRIAHFTECDWVASSLAEFEFENRFLPGGVWVWTILHFSKRELREGGSDSITFRLVVNSHCFHRFLVLYLSVRFAIYAEHLHILLFVLKSVPVFNLLRVLIYFLGPEQSCIFKASNVQVNLRLGWLFYYHNWFGGGGGGGGGGRMRARIVLCQHS